MLAPEPVYRNETLGGRIQCCTSSGGVGVGGGLIYAALGSGGGWGGWIDEAFGMRSVGDREDMQAHVYFYRWLAPRGKNRLIPGQGHYRTRPERATDARAPAAMGRRGGPDAVT